MMLLDVTNYSAEITCLKGVYLSGAVWVCFLTVRAVDPFGRPFRPTGDQLPGWDFAFLDFCLFTFVSCQGLTYNQPFCSHRFIKPKSRKGAGIIFKNHSDL
ncbi:MAG TPA: hypothetical protein HPP97_06705 [Desulfuromonadales bacterium]|nr:hypothetical protein [Desulfuromonadales bacterium]